MNVKKLKIEYQKNKAMKEIFLIKIIYHGLKTKDRKILKIIKGK